MFGRRGKGNARIVDEPQTAVDDRRYRSVHPRFLLAMRFLFSSLVCVFSLASAIMAILVVQWYNSHQPSIPPSWGSCIFMIVLGIFTPIIYFNYNFGLPLLYKMHLLRPGSFLWLLVETRTELMFQFTMCVLWVSGALAYASDLRGYENCLWDGYWHYPKPSSFNHVCDLINWVVPLAYTTFGLQVALWFIETATTVYIFLYHDQDVLSEPMWETGKRAHDHLSRDSFSRVVRDSASSPPAPMTERRGNSGPDSSPLQRALSRASRASTRTSRRTASLFHRGDGPSRAAHGYGSLEDGGGVVHEPAPAHTGMPTPHHRALSRDEEEGGWQIGEEEAAGDDDGLIDYSRLSNKI